MNAGMLRLEAAGNNIANSQTQGYKRQTVLQAEEADGGVMASINRSVQPGENLAQDIVDQITASYIFKANLGVVKTQAEMLGTLLDAEA